MEHIITKYTKPREYYPPDDEPLELGPTEGCREAIKCLQMHCQLLKGSTSKEVLEVFYQEIGIRLIAYASPFRLADAVNNNFCCQDITETYQETDYIAEWRIPGHRRPECIPCVHHLLEGMSQYTMSYYGAFLPAASRCRR